MEINYVNYGDILYKQGVALRIEAFFNGMKNTSDLINDAFEEKSIHLVCLDNDLLIGTGRLTIDNDKGIISQMAIKEEYKRKGVGRKIIHQFIEKCQTSNITILELSARETAIPFYQKQGFSVLGKKYPSLKTGIIHQKIVKNL